MRFSKPSPAMVVALIALVFAMTGTGIAARGLITGKQIKDGSITAKDLANGAVTEKKVADAAITRKKLGKGSVTASSLTPGSVTSAALAPNAVGSDAIAPNAVLAGDLGPGSVTADALAANSVTARAMAERSVAFSSLITSPAPDLTSRKGKSATRAAAQGLYICPNGAISYTGTCIAPTGTVSDANPTHVIHFEAENIGTSIGTSECSATDTRWVKTYGDLVGPVGDGHYFKRLPQTGNGKLVIGIGAQWANVDSSATTFLSSNVGGWQDPDGTANPDPGQLQNGISYGFVNGLNRIEPGKNTANVDQTVTVLPRGYEIFSGGSIACNLKSSGVGAPVLALANANVWAP